MPKNPRFKRPKEVSSKSTIKKIKSSAGDGGIPAKKGKKGGIIDDTIKPVAKIPSSREESSSNWKALLQKQGKPFPVVKSTSLRSVSCTQQQTMDNSEDSRRSRDSEGSEESESLSRSASNSRCSSQLSMTSECANSNVDTESEGGGIGVQKDASQKVKQEFRALGLSESKSSAERKSRAIDRGTKAPRRILKKPPPEGLNEFGYFDYSHYGVLRTPITPAHAEFMEDTGIIAMDCEMVGVGPMKESALARVSIVNEYGFSLYDRFVKPKLDVTDYRTQFSGIRENDLKNAVPFQTVTKEVSEILRGHILIGHSLKSDLAVLYLNHQKAKIRDTAFYFKKILHSKTPKLKMLVKKLLGVEIQQGEHSSITDAQATMALYQLYQKDWEISVKQSNRGIDIFKITLEEFRQMKSGNHNQFHHHGDSQHQQSGAQRDWYEPNCVPPPPYTNNTAYFDNSPAVGGTVVVYPAYSSPLDDFLGGDSAGVSPSGSPPVLDNSVSYENPFPMNHSNLMGEPCFPFPMASNLTFIPFNPCHAHPPPLPMFPPPVSLPLQFPAYCQFADGINGLVAPPPTPMQFPPVPPMMFPPPPPPPQSHFIPHPPPSSMIIPVYHHQHHQPMQCFPFEYAQM